MPRNKKKAKSRKYNRRKAKQKKRSLGRFLFKWMFILAIWAALFGGIALAWYAQDLPDITQAAVFERRASIIIKASDGSTIARYGEEKGESIRAEDLPEHMIQAVMAIEDRRFYSHPGIDILGIARAMLVNTAKGRFVQGGSTITQQLAKNLFLTHERKIQRKIKEAILALWLERQLTKDEILSAYLNRVYMGAGVYGINAASKLYFDKPATQINLNEAAILAGLLKAPSRYNPINNPTLAQKRAKVVLAAMVDAEYISQEDIKNHNASVPTPRTKPTGEKAIRYFADWVVDGLEDLIGTPDMDLVVKTTLDSGIQSRAESTLIGTLLKNSTEKHVTQGAVLVMRPDGAVLAMVGGKDYSASQFNRATQAARAPGSSFKPVVYLTALQNGWQPDSIILDAPIESGDYRPKNFGHKYYGEVTLTDALTFSLNTPAVRLMKDVKPSAVIRTAQKLGIISKLEPDLSLALGSSGISLLEMSTSYAVLANGGRRIYPYAITEIKNREGRVLYTRKKARQYQQVADPQAVSALTGMMQNVIAQGTGRGAKLPFPAAGKTGTSQESRDAWFMGFTDSIVTGVWLGNDDNSPMKGVTGANLPVQIWRNVMSYANNRYDAVRLPTAAGQENRFQNLLGRLMPGSTDTGFTPKPRPKDDYSRLND